MLEILTDLAYNSQVGVEQMVFSSVVACLSLASDYSPGSRELTSSLGRYVFGSEISYNKAPPRLPGLGC